MTGHLNENAWLNVLDIYSYIFKYKNTAVQKFGCFLN